LKGSLSKEILCPFTGSLFFDPVITEDGHTYERLAIECWLTNHETSPLDGSKISTKVLFPNQSMKKMVKQAYDDSKSKQGLNQEKSLI